MIFNREGIKYNMPKTLTLELNIVADADKKTLLQARIPMENLSNILIKHGADAVKESLFQVFNKLAEELKKPAPKA